MNFNGFLQTASQVYNYKYHYLNFIGLFKKVNIYCPLHGYFERVGIYHLYGDQCPSCQQNKQRIYYNYVMQVGDIIKIGRSANVFARLSELSVDLSRQCLLHAAFSYNSRREAWDIERHVQSMFKDYNVSPFNLKFAGSSEFFNVTPLAAKNALSALGGNLVYEYR
ncbi:TPA: GIY-YIG nuclease family protein [Salmonella enterica subsp. diarizonae]